MRPEGEEGEQKRREGGGFRVDQRKAATAAMPKRPPATVADLRLAAALLAADEGALPVVLDAAAAAEELALVALLPAALSTLESDVAPAETADEIDDASLFARQDLVPRAKG